MKKDIHPKYEATAIRCACGKLQFSVLKEIFFTLNVSFQGGLIRVRKSSFYVSNGVLNFLL